MFLGIGYSPMLEKYLLVIIIANLQKTKIMKLLLFIASLLGFLRFALMCYTSWEDNNFNAVVGWGILCIGCMLAANYFGQQIENAKR